MAHRIIINGQELICFTNGEDGMFYEGENKKQHIDFHIRECKLGDQTSYTIDIFNSKIDNQEDAYIESFECDSLPEAVNDGKNYIQDTNVYKPKKPHNLRKNVYD